MGAQLHLARISYLAILFAQLLALGSSRYTAPCQTGVDHPNGDFAGMPLSSWSSTATRCANACALDPQCNLYVFLDAGCAAPSTYSPTCYLKATATAPVAKDCRCSGLPGRGSPGTVKPQDPLYWISAAGISGTMGPTGLAALSFTILNRTSVTAAVPTMIGYAVEMDSWALALDDEMINSTALQPPVVTQLSEASLQYTFEHTTTGATTYLIEVQYDAVPAEPAVGSVPFVRKHIRVATNTPTIPMVIVSVSPWDSLRIVPDDNATLQSVVYPTGELGGYGAFARLSDGSGLFATAENSFLYSITVPARPLWTNSSSTLIHVGYHPFMSWDQVANNSWAPKGDPEPFVADAAILAAYILTNRAVVAAQSAAGEGDGNMPARGCSRSSRTVGGEMLLEEALWGDASLPLIASTADGEIMPLEGDSSAMTLSTAVALDVAEVECFRGVAEARMLLPPSEPIYVSIPWTANDYQIDISNATQWPEYVRILTRLSQLGVTHNLYAGSDSAVSSVKNNTDSWGWEQTLWLNLGQDIRSIAWTPGSSALPLSVAQMVDTGNALGVTNIPYIYPILGFLSDPSWLFPSEGGRFSARLDSRALQDYLVYTILAFVNETDGAGAGFDYTFFQDINATTYAQYAGWRRILTLLRERAPQKKPWVVDNRQSNHAWGPWMWTAGSYAEPMQGDEGPYSWDAYLLDPHTDRQSANHNREMNYLYATSQFCPYSAMPGFIHHQTDRFVEGGGSIPEVDFNIRDFDYYGGAYSVLSSIAVGALNNVVCGLPARDEEEFVNFPLDATASSIGQDVSIAFYKHWFGWTRQNIGTLRYLKPLPFPPKPHSVDGTYAISANSSAGFIFLFNPSAQSLPSPNLLFDTSVDIFCNGPAAAGLLVEELWPIERFLTIVPCGGPFSVQMEARNALVLAVSPLSAAGAVQMETTPMVVGRAARRNTTAILSVSADGVKVDVRGWADVAAPVPNEAAAAAPDHLPGACDSAGTAPLYIEIALPSALLFNLTPEVLLASTAIRTQSLGLTVRLDEVSVEHAYIDAVRHHGGSLLDTTFRAVAAPSRYACVPGSLLAAPPALGESFNARIAVYFSPAAATSFIHGAAVEGMGYNETFAGGILHGNVSLPRLVLDQLSQRAAQYPVPWSAEDAAVAWLNPSRVLLYLDGGSALPQGLNISATWNGAAIPVNPVWSCRSMKRQQCFSGYFIDVTAAGLVADAVYRLSLVLPPMPVGAFGGVYYDNINTVSSNTQ